MAAIPGPAIELVERQFGVIARFQLRRWCSEDTIDGLVRRGTLVSLERGVYRWTGGAALAEQRALAAGLRAQPKATITGPFVLGWLRVDGFTCADPFEILTSPSRRLTGVSFPHRRDPLAARSVARVGEVRLAAPVDALVEAALWRASIGDRPLRVAYDQLRWRGVLTTDRVSRRLRERGERDPAVGCFLEALEGAPLRSESEGERLLAPVLTRLRPMPVPQVWVTPQRRVDWYLHELKFGWEYLGPVDHDYVSRRLADAERDEELAAQGIRLGYVTAADTRHPQALLATVVGTLAVRADQLGVAAPTLAPA
jgi:hypothetical protein